MRVNAKTKKKKGKKPLLTLTPTRFEISTFEILSFNCSGMATRPETSEGDADFWSRVIPKDLQATGEDEEEVVLYLPPRRAAIKASEQLSAQEGTQQESVRVGWV